MMNLENLNYLKETIESGGSLSQKMKSLVTDLVDEKINHISDSTDSFVIFYEDVIQRQLAVIFKEILSEADYANSSEHAKVCLSICGTFKDLPKNAKVGAWLSDALKFVDYLILHYIQEVKKDIINPDDYTGEKSNFGEERRRYDKFKSYERPISDAGAWLEHLYTIRSRIQHNTTVNKKSGKHTLKLPQYNQIQKTISSKYPKILNLIEHIYKE
ncbi:MAG: hypothetical protein H6559_19880 [Lewinellaceae bacterium]|nr:hypothetical protein [Lewinellaceae bacterium]